MHQGERVMAHDRQSFKPISGNVMPRFSGIATFMRLPYLEDPAEAESAAVLERSLRRHASEPLEIFMLKRQELTEVFGYDGVEFQPPADPEVIVRPYSTEFAYTRFLVPWLCGYKGWALFMDCDIACLGDVCQVFRYGLPSLALVCVQHVFRPTTDIKMDGKKQAGYFRKNWSSVMLLNCEALQLWSKQQVETGSPADLHGFKGIPDADIGRLPYRFNEVCEPQDDTVLYHYTEFNPCHNPGRHPHEDLYLRERAFLQDWNAGVRASEDQKPARLAKEH